jgi:hypothetical protein
MRLIKRWLWSRSRGTYGSCYWQEEISYKKYFKGTRYSWREQEWWLNSINRIEVNYSISMQKHTSVKTQHVNFQSLINTLLFLSFLVIFLHWSTGYKSKLKKKHENVYICVLIIFCSGFTNVSTPSHRVIDRAWWADEHMVMSSYDEHVLIR